MARPPSIRRPLLTVMSREVARIQRKQERAHARLESAIKAGVPPDEIARLEAEAALSPHDRDTAESAAKVAALLEKSREPEEEEDAAPRTEADKAASLKRLESAPPPAPVADDDGDTEP